MQTPFFAHLRNCDHTRVHGPNVRSQVEHPVHNLVQVSAALVGLAQEGLEQGLPLIGQIAEVGYTRLHCQGLRRYSAFGQGRAQ